jgi:hypothetical protein
MLAMAGEMGGYCSLTNCEELLFSLNFQLLAFNYFNPRPARRA